MSDGVISKIQLPNGSIYDIGGSDAAIVDTYDSSDYELILSVGSLGDADSTEY